MFSGRSTTTDYYEDVFQLMTLIHLAANLISIILKVDLAYLFSFVSFASFKI